MKKVFLWLFIASIITVFSLAGCKTEAVEKVTGSKIAFESDCDGDFEIFEIYVMDSDGKNEARLIDNDSEDRFPSWSPR